MLLVLRALAALVVALVAVPGGAARPFAACAAEEDRVAVVVDFGGAPGAPDDTTTTCVPMASGDTGADVLVTRAKMLGRPSPRYNSAGLMCSIDGFPEHGCGERGATGYEYWAYSFGGDDGWKRAGTGPALHRTSAGSALGWRFHAAGTATEADPPPRTSARFADLCDSAQSTSTPPPPPTTATDPREAAASPQSTLSGESGRSTITTTSTSSPVDTTMTSEAERSPSAVRTNAEPPEQDEGSDVAPVLLGGGLVALIGGLAALRFRRSR
jgi:hypothetical protein